MSPEYYCYNHINEFFDKLYKQIPSIQLVISIKKIYIFNEPPSIKKIEIVNSAILKNKLFGIVGYEEYKEQYINTPNGVFHPQIIQSWSGHVENKNILIRMTTADKLLELYGQDLSPHHIFKDTQQEICGFDYV